MKFQMDDVPFKYNATYGPGILGGTWDIVDVRSVGDRETYMLWNIYACFSNAFGEFLKVFIPRQQEICETFTY